MATTFASLGLGHLSEDEKRLLVHDLNDELDNWQRNSRQFPVGFNSWEEWIFHIDRQVAHEVEEEMRQEAFEPLIINSKVGTDLQDRT